MSYKVNKVIYLLLGMVLGFFVGGGIIWWQIQEKNNIENETEKHQISNTIDDDNAEVKAKKTALKKKYHAELKKYKIPPTFIDGLKLDSTTLTLEQLIALYSKEEVSDTMKRGNEETINISKDELLYSRVVKVDGQMGDKTDSHDLDSILTDQVKTNKREDNSILVEFWRSPINYKGYKYDNIKLVVFGLLEFDNLNIIARGNELYIRYNKDFYHVDPTDDFKPLIPIKDRNLIKEISSI